MPCYWYPNDCPEENSQKVAKKKKCSNQQQQTNKTHPCVGIWGLPHGLSGRKSTNNAGGVETWVQSLGRKHPLQEEMAICSSILAWKNPMDRGDRQVSPQSCKSIGQDWVTEQQKRNGDFTLLFKISTISPYSVWAPHMFLLPCASP